MAETVDGGHGRIEHRRLHTSDVLVGYSDWPGLAQVFQLERQVISKKTGKSAKRSSLASPVWRWSGLTRRACWRWCGATGTSKVRRRRTGRRLGMS